MDFLTPTQNLLKEISLICQNLGRDPSAVTLVAVSKTFSAETVNRYLQEVQNLFPVPVLGENKVQEVLLKKPHLRPHQLHFIGHLQTNKVKSLLPHIECLHSLDSIKLANTLEKELAENDRRLQVLIQANPTGESSKFGGGWTETRALVDHATKLPHLEVKGLMSLAPFTEEKEIVRDCFRNLRKWRDQLQEETGCPYPELSMGMSHDYPIALEEGATMIRIGSALFGERKYS